MATIRELLQDKQDNIYRQLKKKKKRNMVVRNKKNLSHDDCKKMMGHSSYKRCDGTIKQIRQKKEKGF